MSDMDLIKISPEEVTRVANKFKGEATKSQEMVTTLNGEIERMRTEWAGMTKEAFYTKFQEWKKAMETFTTVLQTIGKELDTTARTFRGTDETLSKQI